MPKHPVAEPFRPVPQSTVDLATARKTFVSHLTAKPAAKGAPAATPPAGTFEVVHYPSKVGPLAAYLTPAPKDGQKHPAIVWAHGGFGGLGTLAWEKDARGRDQSASAFREAGIVMMMPSWRGENDNPGQFELFYGEVDDLLSALDYVKKLPYVDPNRVYLGGHSTGGTLVLLAATENAGFRAAFVLGGAPDVGRIVANGRGYGNTPFDYHNAKEGYLRSATYFTKYIQRPTFYFEGALAPTYLRDVARMAKEAKQVNVPFSAFGIPGHDHFDIVAPITHMLATKILADTGPTCDISITPADLNVAFGMHPPAAHASATAKPSPRSAPVGQKTVAIPTH